MNANGSVDFEQSARRDFVNWVMLAAGLCFAIASLSIAPGDNCDEAGHCHPILVWFGRLFGGLLTVASTVVLIGNRSHGIRFDPESGDLVWWRSRRGAKTSGEGRIRPSNIARIEITTDTDDTTVRLIDVDGQVVPGFSGDVLPWPYEVWARRLVARWPRISLLRIGG